MSPQRRRSIQDLAQAAVVLGQQTPRGDNYIFVQNCDGDMIRTNNSIRTTSEHRNFVIRCGYGDWSGFRTLAECEKQFAELKDYFVKSGGQRTYWVVER